MSIPNPPSRFTLRVAASEVLELFVVYDHPTDFPDWFVIRKQTVLRSGVIHHDPNVQLFHTLAKARAWCEERGLTQIDRDPNDDPVIVETWI